LCVLNCSRNIQWHHPATFLFPPVKTPTRDVEISLFLVSRQSNKPCVWAGLRMTHLHFFSTNRGQMEKIQDVVTVLVVAESCKGHRFSCHIAWGGRRCSRGKKTWATSERVKRFYFSPLLFFVFFPLLLFSSFFHSVHCYTYTQICGMFSFGIHIA